MKMKKGKKPKIVQNSMQQYHRQAVTLENH